MKKRFLVMAMAGLALVGCVSEDVADISQSKEEEKATKITFESPVLYDNENVSRANYHGEIGTISSGSSVRSYPSSEDFIIYAVKYDASTNYPGWEDDNNNQVEYTLFNEVTVRYDGSLDGWVPTKTSGDDPYYYWPEGKQLAYAACSPADLEQEDNWDGRSYSKTGLTLTDFKVPADAANHFDLLFSKRHVDVTKEDMLMTADDYSGAPVVFQHALSSIHFSLANSSESTEIVLRKISLYGINDTGTFTEGIVENITDDNSFEYNRAENGNVTPTWNIATNATKLSKNDAYVAFDAGSNSGLTFPENPQFISDLLLHADNQNAGTNHVLLVLPQTLTENAKLRIDYEVKNGNNTTTAHKVVSLYGAKKWDPVNKQVTEEDINNWEIGTKYTYRLVYSKGAAKKDKIYFSPSSDDWKDAGIAVIDLANAENATD